MILFNSIKTGTISYCLFSSILFLSFNVQAEIKDVPVIAVAANFSPAMQEIVNQYSQLTGNNMRLSTGATGTLARQIEHGAPFQLFLAADESYVEQLSRKGYTMNDGRIYAVGRLAVYIQKTSMQIGDMDIETVFQKMAANDNLKIAIANPELAPYGIAAKQVLERFDLWKIFRDRLILGENVGQTAQFALTGTIDLAFLPWSLVITDRLREQGKFHLVPDHWHSPIQQRMVLLKNAGEVARDLFEFISSDTARKIIYHHGYDLPVK